MGPIKSSGMQLKVMLKKTGRSLKTFDGVEKLDLLHAITNQIKDKIRLGQRMPLTLPELNAFLQVEGLAAGADPKGTIKLLLELRQKQLARLAGYVACGSITEDPQDQNFSLALVELPACKVSDCFSSATHERPSAREAHSGHQQQPGNGPEAVFPAGEDESLEPKATWPISGGNFSKSETQSDQFLEAETQSDCSSLNVVNANANRPWGADVLSIKTSAKDLKIMLQLTGHSLKGLVGTEKLDILNMITDQIKEKVQLRQKMQLTLPVLNAFIALEGLTPGDDAKFAIESLLELRKQQHFRLGRYTLLANQSGQESHPGTDDASFTLALMAIPTEAVHDCFGETANDVVHRIVNAQVVTRKRQHECSNDTGAASEGVAPPTSVPRLGVVACCSKGVVKEMTPDQEEVVARDMGPELMEAILDKFKVARMNELLLRFGIERPPGVKKNGKARLLAQQVPLQELQALLRDEDPGQPTGLSPELEEDFQRRLVAQVASSWTPGPLDAYHVPAVEEAAEAAEAAPMAEKAAVDAVDVPVAADSNDMFAVGSIEAELSPGLKLLLAEQATTFETVHALEGLALGSEQHQDHEEESCDFSLRQAQAACEVDRILATKEVQDILGSGTLEEQRQQFQRIARLLHPDKCYIDANDTRANMALRLALVARKRAGGD